MHIACCGKIKQPDRYMCNLSYMNGNSRLAVWIIRSRAEEMTKGLDNGNNQKDEENMCFS